MLGAEAFRELLVHCSCFVAVYQAVHVLFATGSSSVAASFAGTLSDNPPIRIDLVKELHGLLVYGKRDASAQ